MCRGTVSEKERIGRRQCATKRELVRVPIMTKEDLYFSVKHWTREFKTTLPP